MKPIVFLLAAMVGLASGGAAQAAPGDTVRVSLTADGRELTQFSSAPALSGDGRFVAFESYAPFAADDTNGKLDVYVRDRATGAMTRASLGQGGVQADGGAGYSSISGDGRFVAFQSEATNLVVGDTNARSDVFVRDLLLGTTMRVSVSTAGTQGFGTGSSSGHISTDGSTVAFTTEDSLDLLDVNGVRDVYVRDLVAGTTRAISLGSSDFGRPGGTGTGFPSADGSRIAFHAASTNLVASDADGDWDVYVYDRLASTYSVLTEGANEGAFAKGISGDGASVSIWSRASNLVRGDANGTYDAFVHRAGTIVRASVSSSGGETPAGVVNTDHLPLSSDGRFVAFATISPLVAGDANEQGDVYVRDLLAGGTVRASVNSCGTGGGVFSTGEAGSFDPTLSADGSVSAFRSRAPEFVADDRNGAEDVFVHELGVVRTPPQLALGDAEVAEGDAGTAVLRFTVTKTGDCPLPVSVSFATADGTATAASDYYARSSTIQLAPAETTKAIDVSVLGDLIEELDETLLVRLSAPRYAVVADGEAVGTIRNDDFRPAIVSTTPTGASVARDATIAATFDRDLSSWSIRVEKSGRAVRGAASCDAPCRTVTFTPARPLRYGTTYTVFVTGENAVGSTSTSWSFTTASRR